MATATRTINAEATVDGEKKGVSRRGFLDIMFRPLLEMLGLTKTVTKVRMSEAADIEHNLTILSWMLLPVNFVLGYVFTVWAMTIFASKVIAFIVGVVLAIITGMIIFMFIRAVMEYVSTKGRGWGWQVAK